MKVINLFEMEKVAGGLILSKPVYGISPSLPVRHPNRARAQHERP